MKVDAKLITSCIKKDRRAQSELYELCYVFLMGIGLRYKNNREDAAALVNGCFLKVLTKLEKYKESIPFELWIRRIMINCIIDEFRSNKRS